jgi:hypothetical protein
MKQITQQVGIVIGIGLILSSVIFAQMQDSPSTKRAPTPSEIAKIAEKEKEKKIQGEFRMLKAAIKNSAKDPSSVTFRNPMTHKRGVCIEVNAKNSFGGFTGFSEYCTLTVNGETKIVSR